MKNKTRLAQQLKPKYGDIIEIDEHETLFKSNKKFSREDQSIEALKNHCSK